MLFEDDLLILLLAMLIKRGLTNSRRGLSPVILSVRQLTCLYKTTQDIVSLGSLVRSCVLAKVNTALVMSNKEDCWPPFLAWQPFEHKEEAWFKFLSHKLKEVGHWITGNLRILKESLLIKSWLLETLHRYCNMALRVSVTSRGKSWTMLQDVWLSGNNFF